MQFLASLKGQKIFALVMAVGVILTVGAVLRIHNLDYRTLDHPEVYSPGIDLPWGLTNPNPRFSLSQTLAGSIAGEPHPPGYYILMLGWTRLLGSSIVSLRAPSLLFGVASILLIYFLAYQTEDTLTALLAVSMLALNGLHLYWSQTARMYSMGCFLGLLSTLLMVLIVKRSAQPRTCKILYVVFTVAGLATHVYFWMVFAVQGLWVIAKNLRSHSLPSLLRLQLFTFIVATPLVAIALYQTEAATRPSTLTPLQGVLRFLELGSLFEIDPFPLSTASVNAVAAFLALVATSLLVASLVLRRKKNQATDLQAIGDGYGSPRLLVAGAVAALMALSIVVFAYVAHSLLPGRSTRLVIATSILPITLMFIDFLICNYWGRFKWLQRILAGKMPSLKSLRSLNYFLAILPVTIVAMISLFNPMFIPRGTLLFVPYLLIVISGGLASLVRWDRRWAFVVLIIVIIHGFSIVHFKSKPSDPDYKGLAESWISRIHDSDLIFVHGRGRPGDWLVAPIFYYLNGARYRFAGSDFAEAIKNHPTARV